jgi:hypothetical protein
MQAAAQHGWHDARSICHSGVGHDTIFALTATFFKAEYILKQRIYCFADVQWFFRA